MGAKSRIPLETVKAMAAMRREGVPFATIAQRFGRSLGATHRAITKHEAGIPFNSAKLRRRNMSLASLRRRYKVRALREQGLSFREIAAQLGVSVSVAYYHSDETVRQRRIENSMRWKDANPERTREQQANGQLRQHARLQAELEGVPAIEIYRRWKCLSNVDFKR